MDGEKVKILVFLILLIIPWNVIYADEKAVGVEIVLAVDVSSSVSQKEHEAQIEGIAKVFEDPAILKIIDSLPTGKIAVSLLLWAGENQQLIAVPWKEIRDQKTAQIFADNVRNNQKKPWTGLLYTALGDALQAAGNSFEKNEFEGDRKVIDISSDDPSNRGAEPAIVREILIAQGITINGLPILADRKDQETRRELVDYFRFKVIGGPLSFVNPAVSFEHYAEAFSQKFSIEISGIPSPTSTFSYAKSYLKPSSSELKVTAQFAKRDN
ncbi:DUF1194 domain-containing protein [Sneathiella marina]|uniref:DUF1194 domain-containing protein n=1 Tax=Sneathiella marina TaxID=2950108 RepID=A0ABY4W353_9PROT|nr:DUF1194 domain-containing protein [Sneathiella marina]USG60317.1 DUF1194 domain-containing protein [Sneathiella marina]